MISLKRYLDMKFKKPQPSKLMSAPLLDLAVMSYRRALLAMGKSSYRACAAFGARLQQSLSELAARLSGCLEADVLHGQ